MPTPSQRVEGNTSQVVIGKTWVDSAESKTWSMGGNFKHENQEIPRPTATRSDARKRFAKKAPAAKAGVGWRMRLVHVL